MWRNVEECGVKVQPQTPVSTDDGYLTFTPEALRLSHIYAIRTSKAIPQLQVYRRR